jgi:hypothetical protein
VSEYLDRSGVSVYLDSETVHVFSEAGMGMGTTEVGLVDSVDMSAEDALDRLGRGLLEALARFVPNIDPAEINQRATHTVQGVLGVRNNELAKVLRRVGNAYLGFDASGPEFYVGAWIHRSRGGSTPLLERSIRLPSTATHEELGRVMLDVLQLSLAANLELAASPPKPKRTRAKKAASE